MRAAGAAFNALRLYSLGHALTAQALRVAQTAIHSYLDQFGPLRVVVLPGGLGFDFQPQPYEDGVTAEFARPLRAALVEGVQFLHGVTAEEIGELLEVLRLPRQHLQREGGVGKLLRERGILNVVVEDLVSLPAPPEGEGSLGALLETLRSAPDEVTERLHQVLAAQAQAAEGLLRGIDRAVATWPPHLQRGARSALASAVISTPVPIRRQLWYLIMRSIAEPWAATIAADWSPDAVGPLLAEFESDFAERQRVAEVLQRLRRSAPPVPIPAVELGQDEGRHMALEMTGVRASLREHALRRFMSALPSFDPKRFEACLELMERETVSALAEGDRFALATLMEGMESLAHQLPDVRGELALASLHRMETLRKANP